MEQRRCGEAEGPGGTPRSPAAPIAAGLVVALALVNLRGVRESGRTFAIPTYAFIGLTYLMFLFAAVRAATGTLPPAESSTMPVEQTTAVGGVLTTFLLLRVHRPDRGGGHQQRGAGVPE